MKTPKKKCSNCEYYSHYDGTCFKKYLDTHREWVIKDANKRCVEWEKNEAEWEREIQELQESEWEQENNN